MTAMSRYPAQHRVGLRAGLQQSTHPPEKTEQGNQVLLQIRENKIIKKTEKIKSKSGSSLTVAYQKKRQ